MVNTDFSFYRYHGWFSQKCGDSGLLNYRRMINSEFEKIYILCISKERNNDSFVWDDRKYLGILIGEIAQKFDARVMLKEYWVIIAFLHHCLQAPFYIDTEGTTIVVRFGDGSLFRFCGDTIESSLILSNSADEYGWSNRFINDVWSESKQKFEISNPNLFNQLRDFTEWVKTKISMPTHQPILEPPPFLVEVLLQHQDP